MFGLRRLPIEFRADAPIGKIEGVCYAPDALVRVDFDGGETELYAALDDMDATVVKAVETDGLLIVRPQVRIWAK